MDNYTDYFVRNSRWWNETVIDAHAWSYDLFVGKVSACVRKLGIECQGAVDPKGRVCYFGRGRVYPESYNWYNSKHGSVRKWVYLPGSERYVGMGRVCAKESGSHIAIDNST